MSDQLIRARALVKGFKGQGAGDVQARASLVRDLVRLDHVGDDEAYSKTCATAVNPCRNSSIAWLVFETMALKCVAMTLANFKEWHAKVGLV